MKKGFTLIELLVVIVIIGILVAIALPNFIRVKDKAKEAEVKQNLHAIQLGIERYAVDSDGNNYPFMISGGDWTDALVVWQSWCDTQGLDPANDISNPQRAAEWQAASEELGDSLVMEAYMPSYPGNPFVKKKSDTLLPHIFHYPGAFYPGIAPFQRTVGGRESSKMWECFGPDWTSPLQQFAGDFYVHHIYNNPPYNYQGDEQKNPPGGWKSPSGNKFLTGNFSYWPRAGGEEGAFGLTGVPEVAGYTLSGYGGPRTTGSDVYNRNGNYKGRFRTESCQLDCPLDIYPDIPCICNTGAPPSRIQNDGGSDTVADGVVITLDSGLDKKSTPGSADVTENGG